MVTESIFSQEVVDACFVKRECVRFVRLHIISVRNDSYCLLRSFSTWEEFTFVTIEHWNPWNRRSIAIARPRHRHDWSRLAMFEMFPANGQVSVSSCCPTHTCQRSVLRNFQLICQNLCFLLYICDHFCDMTGVSPHSSDTAFYLTAENSRLSCVPSVLLTLVIGLENTTRFSRILVPWDRNVLEIWAPPSHANPILHLWLPANNGRCQGSLADGHLCWNFCSSCGSQTRSSPENHTIQLHSVVRLISLFCCQAEILLGWWRSKHVSFRTCHE